MKVGTPSTKTIQSVGSTVDNPSFAYQDMARAWELPTALLGGTLRMRELGTKYLPKEQRESDDAYKVRLNRTVLYNVFKRVINSLAGNAFQKAVIIQGVPDELKDLEYNLDGTGRTLTEVAYELFKDCLIYGKAHGVADFPNIDTEGMTLTEWRAEGYRPYLTQINPERLFAWDYHTTHGKTTLDSIRIYEEEIESSLEDEFQEKIVRYIRVITPSLTRVFRNDEEIDNEWTELDSINNSLGYVPLLTAYAEKTGYLIAHPPLEDLAYLNLRHWQSQSDQANILHVARVPILFASGFEDDTLEGMTIGANHLVVASDPESKLSYCEHSGQAIGAGRQDLKDLEEQMATLGADLVIKKGVSRQTATARQIDQSESLSVIQLTLRNIERMLEEFYMIAGEFIGVDASDVTIRIGGDMDLFQDPNSYSSLENLKTTLGLNQEEVIQLAKALNLLPTYMQPKGDAIVDNKEENNPEAIEQDDIANDTEQQALQE